jgi:hypothetical protein
MNHDDIPGLVAGLAPAIRTWTQESVVDPLVQRIRVLEARIAELERRPMGVQYCGTWSQTELYRAGALVTHNGGLWVARSDTHARPGGADSHWQLVVKSGRAQP